MSDLYRIDRSVDDRIEDYWGWEQLAEQGVLVPVEPVGAIDVDKYNDVRSDVVYGEYGYGIVAPHLPPGKYDIVLRKADDE